MHGIRPSRRAFTLLELLIVLAVVAGVAALCWPAVRGLWAKSEVLSAAKQLRAALARARLDAMESGAARQFRYQPGTRRFEIAVWNAPGSDVPQSGGSDLEVRPPGEPAESELPSGVRFDHPGAGDVLLGLDEPPMALDEESWTAPILFLPNGRTSNAKIHLLGRRGYIVDVALRGVTGAVAIGKVQVAEEWP